MEAAEGASEAGRGAVAASPTRHLVEAAIGGDATAFEVLISGRIRRTYRIALGILGSTADANDVTQEAWILAWRRLGSLRDVERFDSWLDRIVVNACRMSVRQRGRLRQIPMADGFDRPTTSPGPEHVAERDAIERAFERLTVDHRTVLVLHHVEERPLGVIAEVLGIPVGTAKSRLHAARAALDRAMKDER